MSFSFLNVATIESEENNDNILKDINTNYNHKSKTLKNKNIINKKIQANLLKDLINKDSDNEEEYEDFKNEEDNDDNNFNSNPYYYNLKPNDFKKSEQSLK